MIVTPASAACTKFGYFARVVTFEGQTFAMMRENPVDTTSGIYYQVQAVDPQVGKDFLDLQAGDVVRQILTMGADVSNTVGNP